MKKTLLLSILLCSCVSLLACGAAEDTGEKTAGVQEGPAMSETDETNQCIGLLSCSTDSKKCCSGELDHAEKWGKSCPSTSGAKRGWVCCLRSGTRVTNPQQCCSQSSHPDGAGLACD